MAFNDHSVLHKITTQNFSEYELGTMKFSLDRFVELIDTMARNHEILGSKFRTNCQQKLNEQIKRFDKINSKLLGDVNNWHKSLQKEHKILMRAEQHYHEKRKQQIKEELNLKNENLKYIEFKKTNKITDTKNLAKTENNLEKISKISQYENNIHNENNTTLFSKITT